MRLLCSKSSHGFVFLQAHVAPEILLKPAPSLGLGLKEHPLDLPYPLSSSSVPLSRDGTHGSAFLFADSTGCWGLEGGRGEGTLLCPLLSSSAQNPLQPITEAQ